MGRPVPHVSAKKHTTGEAMYLDDIPTMNSMCVACVILLNIKMKIQLKMKQFQCFSIFLLDHPKYFYSTQFK